MMIFILTCLVSFPRDSAAFSLSRTALSTLPRGERTIFSLYRYTTPATTRSSIVAAVKRSSPGRNDSGSGIWTPSVPPTRGV